MIFYRPRVLGGSKELPPPQDSDTPIKTPSELLMRQIEEASRSTSSRSPESSMGSIFSQASTSTSASSDVSSAFLERLAADSKPQRASHSDERQGTITHAPKLAVGSTSKTTLAVIQLVFESFHQVPYIKIVAGVVLQIIQISEVLSHVMYYHIGIPLMSSFKGHTGL